VQHLPVGWGELDNSRMDETARFTGMQPNIGGRNVTSRRPGSTPLESFEEKSPYQVEGSNP
jgi:hypothetical protein